METVLSRLKKTETIGAIAIARIEHCSIQEIDAIV